MQADIGCRSGSRKLKAFPADGFHFTYTAGGEVGVQGAQKRFKLTVVKVGEECCKIILAN